MTDRQLLFAIQRALDGTVWSFETTATIARLLTTNGYPVAPPDDGLSPRDKCDVCGDAHGDDPEDDIEF